MSDQLKLTADSSRTTGSRATRRLRREGRVPGVIYGLAQDPTSVSVVYGDLRAAMSTDAGLNALLDIEVDGQTDSCIVKDLQRHPVRDEVVHVDFIRIDPNEEIQVDVPVILVGEAKQVEQNNGMVDQNVFQLSIFAKPGSIPNELQADISELDVGDSVRVGDLALPAGVRTEVDADEAVAVGMVTRSTLEAMAEEEAAEAAAELAGDGGDAGGDDAAAAEASDED